jgi:hypothetical protein
MQLGQQQQQQQKHPDSAISVGDNDLANVQASGEAGDYK